MCGNAGFACRATAKGDRGVQRSMADAVAHRGPDDEGYIEAQSRSGKYKVGLAHRRLSIIDLDTGHQPIGNEDDSIQIVFNGEIYNFQPLRDELIARGHTFKTNSDTETIVHAYEEYGTSCVNRLRGMFAFAIWDANRERLFIARDRFGKKPLFLRREGEQLHFASEIKALLAADNANIEVNIGSIRDYLLYRYVPAPQTLIRGIEKLPPGSFAVWQAGNLYVERYYAPPDLKPLGRSSVPDEPVGEFLDKLDDAVACLMISDVPFFAFLSGGIYSSAFVSLMARHSQLPVKTFSVGFSESQYS